MSAENFKETYNIWYFLGFLAILAMPTLPMTITWSRVALGW